MNSDIGKLLSAIEKIVKDSDKKYDECMVEQFLKSTSEELQKLDHEVWKHQAKTILEKLQSFVNDEAFVMMNQARVYKTYLSVIGSDKFTDDSLATFQDYFDNFWSSLASVIINHDLAAITAVLMTIRTMLRIESIYHWVIAKEFKPSLHVLVRGRTFDIRDVVTLTEFYVETSENYHTKNKAELLLKDLMENTIERKLDPNHPHVIILREISSKLIRSETTSILYILIDMIEENQSSIAKNALLDCFNIRALLYERFLTSCKKSEGNLSTICKLLGLIDDPTSSDSVLSILRQKGQIESMIAFLSGSRDRGNKSLLQVYLLGSIALTTGTKLSPEVEAVVKQLDHLKGYVTDKTVTTCLVQLGRIIDHAPTSLTDLDTVLHIRILLDYIRCSLDTPRKFKNVMLCCSNLSKFLDRHDKPDKHSLMLINSTAMEALQTSNIKDENLKPIVLFLIKLLSDSLKTKLSTSEGIDHEDESLIERVASLASTCNDSEIQDEFNLFLQKFQKGYCPKSSEEDYTKQLEEEFVKEEYRADIKSNLNDILDYELFADNILDCY